MRNPYLNALLASAYIALIALFFRYVPEAPGIASDAVLIPIIILSLLVLSVAVMGYLFFYEPTHFYMTGEKKQAVQFFLKTIGTFAAITIILIGIVFLIGILA
jgi:ABC-type multidrug transport system permease subunit